jgi:hypothetical protein
MLSGAILGALTDYGRGIRKVALEAGYQALFTLDSLPQGIGRFISKGKILEVGTAEFEVCYGGAQQPALTSEHIHTWSDHSGAGFLRVLSGV